MKHKPHWYFIYYYECPVCGCGPTYRERRYDPKPEKWEDRHEYVNPAIAYDGCVG